MMPPAFSLTADGGDGGDKPIQRQEAAGGGDAQAQPTMMERVSSFFTNIGSWFKGLFGGGGTQPATNSGNAGANTANPTTSNPTTASPSTTAPANPTTAGPQDQPANPTTAGPQQQPANAAANPSPTTVNVTNSVGVGGTNNPADVRAVQDRLQTLGYLSSTDHAAEQVPANGTAPVLETAMPLTIVAISRYMMGAFGRPGMLIEPNQASSSFLNNAMTTALGNVGVGGDVGRGAQNNAADVRAVQMRLNALGYLQDPGYTAELVAANATGRIADAALGQTIAAINNFNVAVPGTSLSVIRANSREQELLNNPPRYTRGTLSITNTVGTGGNNAPTDVTALQARLVQLGFLTAAQQTAEAPPAGSTALIPAGSLTQTIAAVNQFQQAMNIAQTGSVAPGNETHRQLINPMLPEKATVTLTDSVGRGGRNNRADVRRVQDRLQALGVLSTTHYMAERVDTSAPGVVAMTTVPNTQAAIDRFTSTAAGSSDGRIDAGGKANRILNDPTGGTLTNFNLESNNTAAGYDWQSGNAAVNRVITAIEAIEAGNLVGEVPANYVNGAGVSASFGKAQVIGGTGLGTIDNSAGMQAHYGLTDAQITTMRNSAASTVTHYDAIYADTPQAGLTAAALQARVAAYTAAHGVEFVQQTGLGYEDIERMYHTANIRRRIIAVPVTRNDQVVQGVGATAAARQASQTQIINDSTAALIANADFNASYTYLGFNLSTLKGYFKNTKHLGENKAGFVTKAIFNGAQGQQIRNAMTDNGGNAIGRTFIEQTYNGANGNNGVPANTPNRPRAVAAVTAYIHNHGGSASALAANMANVYGDGYVTRFLQEWD